MSEMRISITLRDSVKGRLIPTDTVYGVPAGEALAASGVDALRQSIL